MRKVNGGENILNYTILDHKGYKSFEDKMKKFEMHKPYDKIFKTILKQNPKGFLIVFKIPARFEGFIDSEIINYFYQELHVDILMKAYGDGIYVIEFQSTKLTLDDITRFGNYMGSLVHKYKADIHLYVITTAHEKMRKITKKFGEYEFTIYIVSLTEFDYNKALNRIKYKIENKEWFKEEDIVLVETIPFMARKEKEKKKLLKTVAELTNQLDGLISNSKLIEIKTMQFVLACEILNDNEKDKIAPVITMKTEEKEEVFQGYLTKEEQEEFIEKGKEEEKEKIVKNLIKLGQTPEFIEKATNMNKAQIAALTTTII